MLAAGLTLIRSDYAVAHAVMVYAFYIRTKFVYCLDGSNFVLDDFITKKDGNT